MQCLEVDKNGIGTKKCLGYRRAAMYSRDALVFMGIFYEGLSIRVASTGDCE